MLKVAVTIRFRDKQPVTTSGYEFKVHDMPFVVHRTVPEQMKGNGWTVTEPRSGAAITTYTKGRTRREAVDQAVRVLDAKKKDEIEKAIRRQERNGR